MRGCHLVGRSYTAFYFFFHSNLGSWFNMKGLHLSFWVFAVELAGLSHASCSAKPKNFYLTLTPNLDPLGYTLDGTLVLDHRVSNNETLLFMPTQIASVATADYGDRLVASDADGLLPLSSREVKNGPFNLPHRLWSVQRATTGPITVRFKAHPNHVNRTALPGPHFDLRNGTDGLTGSMWAIIPTPNALSEEIYNFTLFWNISNTHGAAFTHHDGVGPHEYSFVGPLTKLLQTFFIVGDVHAHPQIPTAPEAKFSMYWLEEPPFDPEATSAKLKMLLEYSADFWQDRADEAYRVFVRVNEETSAGSVAPGAGGTAFPRAFLFGYNRDTGIPKDRLLRLLAHEMTHEWTTWSAGTNAEQSRYNEGSAEYWSLRLLWRLGLISAEEFLNDMNTRALDYYANPASNLSDEKAQEIAWQVRPAQRVPYGRGMLHFTNIDAQLRATSNGTLKLDDLAIPFLHVCRDRGSCGANEWFSLLSGALGEAAVAEWKRVSEGQPLVLQQGSLGHCFEVVRDDAVESAYHWQARKGVNISSPACII
jgi:hypothetical protein